MSDLIAEAKKYAANGSYRREAMRDLMLELANALEQAQAYEPYPGDQALAGPDMPPMKTILNLIRYCTTVHSRFGNTCVAGLSLKWGGTALNYKDDQQNRITELEAVAIAAKTLYLQLHNIKEVRPRWANDAVCKAMVVIGKALKTEQGE